MKLSTIHNSKIYWFALSLFAILGWQWIEMSAIGEVNIHQTADDFSYITPFKNWMEMGLWKENFTGASSYIQRPPLVGLLYGLTSFVFRVNTWLGWLMLTSILQAISTVLLFSLVRTRQMPYGVVVLYLYTLVPVFSGFVGYRISESLLPFLVIYGIYSFIGHRSGKGMHQSVSMALIYLCRPVLLLFFIPLALRRVFKWTFSPTLKLPAAIGLVVLMVSVGFWEYRKIHFSGEVWNPHPIYHPTNETLFRAPHEAITDVFRCFEHKSEHFHYWMALCDQGKFGPDKETELREYLSEQNASDIFEDLNQLLLTYGKEHQAVKASFNGQTKSYTPAEIELSERACELEEKYKRNHRIQSTFTTPILSLKHLALKSHLNLVIFQKTFKGHPIMEIFRWCVFGLLLTCYLAIPISLFSRKNTYKLIATGAFIYLWYIGFVQVLNEDRYMLPFIIVGLFLLSPAIRVIQRLFGRRRNLQIEV